MLYEYLADVLAACDMVLFGFFVYFLEYGVVDAEADWGSGVHFVIILLRDEYLNGGIFFNVL